MAPNDASRPKLVIIEGKDKGKVISIQPGSTVIGRTKGDVILQDSRISRSHVSLNYDARSGKLTFSDLKSLNGTLLNGNVVEGGVLIDGDRLQVGNTLFDCQLSDGTELAEIKRPKASNELKEFNETPQTSSVSQPRKEPPTPAASAPPPPVAPKLELNSPDPAPAAVDPLSVGLSSGEFGSSSKKKDSSEKTQMFSPRVRNYTLAVLFLAVAYFFSGGGNHGPSEDFTRGLTSLKQLEKEGKVTEAIQKAEALSQSYDGDPELFVTLGGLYAQQKRYEPAIQAFRKAKTLSPEHPVATVQLIALYLRSGLAKEAEAQMAELDELMKTGKHSRELFIEAAGLFLEFKELTRSPEKALILSRALQNELAVDSTIGYKLEAQLMFQQNQNEEALKVIERGLQRDPQDEWLLENLAFAKLSQKDNIGAATVVENWIRLHPENTKALLVMGYLKYNDKNGLAALPYLQKIVQVAKAQGPDAFYSEALHLMGQIYWMQGQAQEAKGLFSQACENGFAQSCSHELLRDPQSVNPKEIAKPSKN